MRIGILTFSQAINYGAFLQEYALQTYLRSLGHECEIINYINDHFEHMYSPTKRVSIRNLKSSVKNFVTLRSYWSAQKKRNFLEFEDKNIIISKEVYRKNNHKKCVEEYDLIITGSDQVFNTLLTKDDYSYYLDFVPNIKSAAYAPSFGYGKLPKSQDADRTVELLNNIQFLSVRELSGKELIYSLTGKEVPVVLDPTLLLSKEHWMRFVKNNRIKEKYVLLYTFESGSINDYVYQYAAENKLKIVKINASVKDFFNKDIIIKNGVGIEEFLTLIYYADSIVTNSYHGMIFSFLFEKNFTVYAHQSNSDINIRMRDFLQQFGLKERLIQKAGNIENNIDYSFTYALLENQRRQSKEFIMSMINGIGVM